MIYELLLIIGLPFLIMALCMAFNYHPLSILVLTLENSHSRTAYPFLNYRRIGMHLLNL